MSKQPAKNGILALLICLIAAILLQGCGRHPKATSRDSLDFIKQVYTACNTKSLKRLAECERRFADLKEAGKMSTAEAKSFQEILEMAKDAKWDVAQGKAMQFARDQTN